MSRFGRTPTLAEALQVLLDDFSADLYTACPGVVESYDPGTQVAVVKPTIKRVAREGLDSDRVVDELPSLHVPVCWPRAGGYFVTMPLAAGDSGLIVFCQRPIGSWRDSGVVSDPGDEGTHTIAGGVFVPGLETTSRALPSGEGGGAGHMVLGKSGGPTIHVDASSVQLGAAGGNFVALANLVQTALDAIKTTFNAHTHAAPGGTTSTPGTPLATIGPVAASQVKAT